MAEQPRHADTGDDSREAAGSGSTTGRSRRIYAYWIIGIVLALLFVVLHLTGGRRPCGPLVPASSVGAKR